jgi:hypothetical protein
MPYVREKTWIQMAPKIRGLSLKESQRGFGMGQASCDPADLDCLNSLLGPSGEFTGISASGGNLLVGTNPATGLPTGTVPNPLITWLQNNQTTVLWLGGSLFAIALFAGMTGRR